MGLILMLGTGSLLYHHHSLARPQDMSFGAWLLVIVMHEVVLTIFLLASCCVIWAVAAPHWIERFFEKIISKVIIALAPISFLLLGVMIYVFSVGM
jgi:hypothetical protein